MINYALSDLGGGGLVPMIDDCPECGNTGLIATQAASVTIEVPCPACPRSDWHAHDAALGWAEQ